MADTHEDILARLVVLMGDVVPGVDAVTRDQLVGDDAKDRRKVINVLRGDEMADEEDLARSRNQPSTAPRLVHMQPQIELHNFADASAVGSGLSAIRKAVINIIANDSVLIEMTHKNAGGRYLGLQGDLAFGREMAGQITLKFGFAYLMYPGSL
jgi:cystathionine beta-lyase/cystathionine gamma-synthase